MVSRSLLWRIRNEIGPFLLNSLINKLLYLKNYYSFATISLGCEGYFLQNYPKRGVQNAIFMVKSYEVNLFATLSHGCKGEQILCNHYSWLRRILFLFKLWLTFAKRLISWNFPNLFMKISWLLKTCIHTWIWQKSLVGKMC